MILAVMVLTILAVGGLPVIAPHKNPFFLRAVRRWDGTKIVLGAGGYILLTVGLPCSVVGAREAAQYVVGLGAVGVTLAAVIFSLYTYTEEVERGTIIPASLTGMSPWDEIGARYLGATLPALGAWLVTLLAVPCTGAADLPQLLTFWLFIGFWAMAMGAVALACSTGARTLPQGLLTVVSVVFAATCVYGYADGIMGGTCWTLAPPDAAAPVLVWQLVTGGGNPLPIFAVWLLGTLAILKIAEVRLRTGAPLQAAACAARTPSGLQPNAPSQFCGLRRPSRESNLTSQIFDRLLGRLRCNPYYVAYKRGYGRLYYREASAPGSVLPPALVVGGLLTWGIFYIASGVDSEAMGMGASALLAFLMPAWFISVMEALSLSARSLQAEQDQATWSLLVASGMRPEQVLVGKFITVFYALSGEWMITVPFWLAAGLAAPGMVAVGLVHPLLIAAASVFGLLAGIRADGDFRRRRLAITAAVTALTICPVVLALATLTGRTLMYGLAVRLCDYFHPWLLVYRLSSSSAETLVQGVLQVTVLLVATAAFIAFVALMARARMTTAMRGG